MVVVKIPFIFRDICIWFPFLLLNPSIIFKFIFNFFGITWAKSFCKFIFDCLNLKCWFLLFYPLLLIMLSFKILVNTETMPQGKMNAAKDMKITAECRNFSSSCIFPAMYKMRNIFCPKTEERNIQVEHMQTTSIDLPVSSTQLTLKSQDTLRNLITLFVHLKF